MYVDIVVSMTYAHDHQSYWIRNNIRSGGGGGGVAKFVPPHHCVAGGAGGGKRLRCRSVRQPTSGRTSGRDRAPALLFPLFRAPVDHCLRSATCGDRRARWCARHADLTCWAGGVGGSLMMVVRACVSVRAGEGGASRDCALVGCFAARVPVQQDGLIDRELLMDGHGVNRLFVCSSSILSFSIASL